MCSSDKIKNNPFSGASMWIWGPGGNWQNDFNALSPFRTCYFRKDFHVPAAGAKLTVHVSADSRYTLYVNGRRVCAGPAKGDIAHQFYDTLVLDPYLQPGRNTIAAVVICFSGVHPNYSELGVPLSIMTATPAFILDGLLMDHEDSKILEPLHTNSSWKSRPDLGYGHHRSLNALGIVSGLGEDLFYDKYPEGWYSDGHSDGKWLSAAELAAGVTRESVMDSPLPYRLTPRIIPLLREEDRRFNGVYQTNNIHREVINECILKGSTVEIPPRQKVSFILDAGELTTGYPVVAFSQGRNSEVTLVYSEALYKDGRKTVEKVQEGGDVEGLHDSFLCDGIEHTYEPLHWRTFRYVKVEVVTKDETLIIGDISYRFAAYPLNLKADFQSSDDRHKSIWDITFRTLQLCCHETYEDCPYYEQNQYAGDSQIISLVTGYMTGDWRLTRQAVLMFNWSADYEGITKSRYPNRVPQIIPSWSLLWIVMVYEYWWHTGDIETAAACKNTIKSTLNWFEGFLNERYLLDKLNYWTVVDWVKEWDNPPGNPPGASGGETGLISAQYTYCLKLAAVLFDTFGQAREAEHYRQLYQKVKDSIDTYCWNEDKGLYRDCPQLDTYSELGNAWPIIAGCASMERAAKICDQFNRNESLAKSTLYGRYYIFRALEEGGRYEKFSELLDWWHIMMDSDLTTWPEEPWLARSYCHAWSCSPGYEFLSGILGVKPMKAGFDEILIAPKPCGLKWAKGSVPTPRGTVQVSWEIIGSKMNIDVKVPEGVEYSIVIPEEYGM